MKVEPLVYGDKKVYTVAGFNKGVATWIERLPTLWIEGEVTELKRNARWASAFFTLKDPEDGACLPASISRAKLDALKLDLADGERVHVFGRPELYEVKAEFRLRVLTIERFGLGDHLARLDRLKRALAAEGLFAQERKRALPRLPRKIGLVTGNDAAAKRDVLTTIANRFPPAHVVVAETYVQGPRAAAAMVEAIDALSRVEGVDVIVLARGGGSFEDLLPFSDERLVRAVAASAVPIVSAVGHEQDTPLCDLAADVRASTPTAAGKIVVPDLAELLERLGRSRTQLGTAAQRTFERHAQRLERAHTGLGSGARRTVERHGQTLARVHERLNRAPSLLVERKRARLDRAGAQLRALSPKATLERGYAIVRTDRGVVRAADEVASGERVAVEVADGSFGARVE
jgi:exodeoxyribonuclease VII large subunit